MKFRYLLALIAINFFTCCVSPRKFNQLEKEYQKTSNELLKCKSYNINLESNSVEDNVKDIDAVTPKTVEDSRLQTTSK